MKILIIGSKGFIGSHAFRFFNSKPENEVWGCDVMVDYGAERYILIDATNADFEDLFKSHSFDICLNCAGAASVPDSLVNPLRDYFLNTKYIFLILEAIRKHVPSCKFLNLSSAAIYGNPQYLPIDESHKIQPMSPYGWHKYQSEIICQEFAEMFKISVCSLRIFSAYGPGLKKQLFWDMYQKTKYSESVTLYGTGNESRDFIYIDDLINAIEVIIKNNNQIHQVINIANGEEITIGEAAHLFYSNLPYKGKLSFNGAKKEGDPVNWKSDISKLKAFGYKPQTTFEEGLKKYIQWLRENA